MESIYLPLKSMLRKLDELLTDINNHSFSCAMELHSLAYDITLNKDFTLTYARAFMKSALILLANKIHENFHKFESAIDFDVYFDFWKRWDATFHILSNSLLPIQDYFHLWLPDNDYDIYFECCQIFKNYSLMPLKDNLIKCFFDKITSTYISNGNFNSLVKFSSFVELYLKGFVFEKYYVQTLITLFNNYFLQNANQFKETNYNIEDFKKFLFLHDFVAKVSKELKFSFEDQLIEQLNLIWKKFFIKQLIEHGFNEAFISKKYDDLHLIYLAASKICDDDINSLICKLFHNYVSNYLHSSLLKTLNNFFSLQERRTFIKSISSYFVESIAHEYCKFRTIVHLCFLDDFNYLNCCESAFSSFVSYNPLTTPYHSSLLGIEQQSSAFILAHYCNYFLQKTYDIGSFYNNAALVFRFLEDKDLFQHLHAHYLLQRLLKRSSVSYKCIREASKHIGNQDYDNFNSNSISTELFLSQKNDKKLKDFIKIVDDVPNLSDLDDTAVFSESNIDLCVNKLFSENKTPEIQFINIIKSITGSSYIHPFKVLIKDCILSNVYKHSFINREIYETNINVFMLSYLPWINIDLKAEYNLLIPDNIISVFKKLKYSFAQHTNGRKHFHLIHSMSIVIFDYEGSSLFTTGEQALILLAFNKKDSFSLKELMDITGIEKEHIERALKGLVTVISSNSTEFDMTTIFSLNSSISLDLSSGLGYLPRIPVLSYHRSNIIKSQICSLMKHNKTMDFNAISKQLKEIIKDFSPSEKLITDVIRQLIVNKYIKEVGNQKYEYIP